MDEELTELIFERKHAPVHDTHTYFLILTAFAVSVAIIFFIPLSLCSIGQCTLYEGQYSISSVIQAFPYATIYCWWGAIYLFSQLYIQLRHLKRGIKVICAIGGAICLGIPLMLPLDSGVNDIYHEIFAVAGFAFEALLTFCIMVDIFSRETLPRGYELICMCSLGMATAIILYGVGSISAVENTEFYVVYQITAEYFVGSSTAALVATLEFFPIYPHGTKSLTDLDCL